MYSMVLIFCTFGLFAQEQPKIEPAKKKEVTEKPVKEVPKATQIKKDQQKKQVKKAQIKQQRATQVIERRRAIKRKVAQQRQ